MQLQQHSRMLNRTCAGSFDAPLICDTFALFAPSSFCLCDAAVHQVGSLLENELRRRLKHGKMSDAVHATVQASLDSVTFPDQPVYVDSVARSFIHLLGRFVCHDEVLVSRRSRPNDDADAELCFGALFSLSALVTSIPHVRRLLVSGTRGMPNLTASSPTCAAWRPKWRPS